MTGARSFGTAPLGLPYPHFDDGLLDVRLSLRILGQMIADVIGSYAFRKTSR